MKPIRWRRLPQSSGVRGDVGGVTLFQVSWALMATASTPWQLSSTLPGPRQDTRHASIEAAQAAAEAMLATFAELIGATP